MYPVSHRGSKHSSENTVQGKNSVSHKVIVLDLRKKKNAHLKQIRTYDLVYTKKGPRLGHGDRLVTLKLKDPY